MVIPNEIVFSEVEARLARGEGATIPMKGRSMEPFLWEGDHVSLVPARKVRRGDVVLFRYQGRHLLHRCLGRWRGRYIMRGDACHSSERVGEEAVVGCLKEVFPSRIDWRRLRLRLARWYFLCLFILMWGYFGGIPIESNFIFGIRIDHLVHASVYIPCTWFLFRRRPWLAACGIALLTEGVQYVLPWRGFDVNDLVANLLGVALGWIILRLFLRISKK